jgi:hypothetical protein
VLNLKDELAKERAEIVEETPHNSCHNQIVLGLQMYVGWHTFLLNLQQATNGSVLLTPTLTLTLEVCVAKLAC